MSVLGVHGIGRHREGNEASMLADWRQALARGVAASATPDASWELSLAYYRPLFAAAADRLGLGLGLGLGLEEADDLSDAEVDFLAELAEEAAAGLPEDQLASAEQVRPDLGVGMPPVDPTVLRAWRIFDAGWGRGASALMMARVRQVHAYLSDEHLAEEIRGVVAGSLKEQTTALAAHSLGSVVAYDLARRGGSASVRRLVTFGSPLGWKTVRSRLEQNLATGFGVPHSLEWLNVHDRRDPVTAGVGLSRLGVGIRDIQVDNGERDAHGAVRYLRHGEVAGAVLDGVTTADAR